jgi:hypothetical protein
MATFRTSETSVIIAPYNIESRESENRFEKQTTFATIIFKHPVAFIYTSYTKYIFFNAT